MFSTGAACAPYEWLFQFVKLWCVGKLRLKMNRNRRLAPQSNNRLEKRRTKIECACGTQNPIVLLMFSVIKFLALHLTFSAYSNFANLKSICRIDELNFVALCSLWTRKYGPIASSWVSCSSTRVTIPIICTHLHCGSFHLVTLKKMWNDDGWITVIVFVIQRKKKLVPVSFKYA